MTKVWQGLHSFSYCPAPIKQLFQDSRFRLFPAAPYQLLSSLVVEVTIASYWCQKLDVSLSIVAFFTLVHDFADCFSINSKLLNHLLVFPVCTEGIPTDMVSKTRNMVKPG
jgi:hypothetical protein